MRSIDIADDYRYQHGKQDQEPQHGRTVGKASSLFERYIRRRQLSDACSLDALRKSVAEGHDREMRVTMLLRAAKFCGLIDCAHSSNRQMTKSPHGLQNRLLPPLVKPSSALNSPRDLQRLGKTREEAVRQEFYKEREELEQKFEKQFDMQKRDLTLQAKETIWQQIEQRRHIYQQRIKQDADLYRSGRAKAEEVSVVTTANLPGHKVKDVLGAVMGSYKLK